MHRDSLRHWGNNQMVPRDPEAPSNILDHVQTRTELRDYLDRQLPGWHTWFDTALVVLGTREADELRLETRNTIIERLESLADEMYAELGELGSRIGREYAQRDPFFDISRQRGLEPMSRWPAEGADVSTVTAPGDPLPLTADAKGVRPFSHVQLGNRVVSRDVIGNLLALGHLRTLNRQRRTGLEVRRSWAAQLVAHDLIQYTSGAARPVLPPQYDDPGFETTLARTGPVPWALAVVVAVYLGLPGRVGGASEQHDSDTLELPLKVFEKTSTKLREAVNGPEPDPWRIPQGML